MTLLDPDPGLTRRPAQKSAKCDEAGGVVCSTCHETCSDDACGFHTYPIASAARRTAPFIASVAALAASGAYYALAW